MAGLLKEARVRTGLRQVDVAQRLGQPQSFVSKYESGERTLTLCEVEAVCKAIGIKLIDFIRRYESSSE